MSEAGAGISPGVRSSSPDHRSSYVSGEKHPNSRNVQGWQNMRRNGAAKSAQVRQVRQVRAELHALRSIHGKFVTDIQVAGLFAVVGDAGVCADALGLWPRPEWVERVCGPYPPSLELANPEDTASVEEWGSGGTGT